MTKNITKLNDKIQEQLSQIPDFEELLLNSEDIDQRLKSLWITIYSNVTDDRERVSILYTEIFREVTNNAQGHAIYGPLVTKYLEKMAKCNDQLIKLSELIMAHHNAGAQVNPDELLDNFES